MNISRCSILLDFSLFSIICGVGEGEREGERGEVTHCHYATGRVY